MKELVRHGSKGNNKRKEVKRKRVTLKQESKSKWKTQVNGKKKEKKLLVLDCHLQIQLLHTLSLFHSNG